MQPVTVGELLLRATSAAGVGLGGAPLGNLYSALADDHAVATIRHAWSLGIRYFDTAPHYGQGLSERRFGRALRDKPRDEFVLSTKVGRLLRADATAAQTQHGYVGVPPLTTDCDYTRDGFMRALEASRDRLGVERIDIVYVHDLDTATHGERFAQHWRSFLESGLAALAELKGSGDIAAFGIGVNGVAISLATLREADIDVLLLAGRYTLADQSAVAELLPLCLARGVAVIAGGPFNSGILATGSQPASGNAPYFDYAPASLEMIRKVAAIEAVCARHGVPLRAAALQFPALHPAIAAVLAGARSIGEIDDLVSMRRCAIAREFWVELHERGLVDAAAPLPDPNCPR